MPTAHEYVTPAGRPEGMKAAILCTLGYSQYSSPVEIFYSKVHFLCKQHGRLLLLLLLLMLKSVVHSRWPVEMFKSWSCFKVAKQAGGNIHVADIAAVRIVSTRHPHSDRIVHVADAATEHIVTTRWGAHDHVAPLLSSPGPHSAVYYTPCRDDRLVTLSKMYCVQCGTYCLLQ